MTIFPSCIAGSGALVAIVMLAACTGASTVGEEVSSRSASAVQRSNPASRHCVEQGGTHERERRLDGGQYGLCVFPDNRQCEEWAMMRGNCPVGGIRVTGYATSAARYCAITGGRYTVVARSGAADEQGICAFSNGKTCDADAYYKGTCRRG